MRLDLCIVQGVDLMPIGVAIENKKFHGFDSPLDALNYYYKHQLNDRHTDCFEFRQEKALLEWLFARDMENDGNA